MSSYVIVDFFEVKDDKNILHLMGDKVFPSLKRLLLGYRLPEDISEVKLSSGIETELKTMLTEKDDDRIEFFNSQSFKSYLDITRERYKLKSLECFRKTEALNLIDYMKLSDEEKENVDTTIDDAKTELEGLEETIDCLLYVLGVFEIFETNSSGSIYMAVSYDY